MDRTHVGEVDFLRVFGLVTIVIIHSLGFFLALPVSGANIRIAQELSVNLLRFGRFVFIFVTGLVLFYNYSGRRLNTARFFTRRLQNLVIPYAIWTALYLLNDHWSKIVNWHGLNGYVILWLQNLLSGKACYHLYYILVAIQFYLLFPVAVRYFKPKNPRLWAGIIMAGGLLLSAFYYYVLDMHAAAVTAMFAGTHWASIAGWIMQYRDRMFISYLPYFLLGGLAGIYMEDWKKWLGEHRELVLGGLIASAAFVAFEFFHFFLHGGESWALTVSVFKPSLYLYSLAIIAVFFKLSAVLGKVAPLRSLVTLLAANSLGIYLIHPAVLYVFHSYLWRLQHLPGYMLVVLDPAAAIAVSCFLSMLLGSSRYTRIIIGEAGNLRKSLQWRRKTSGHKGNINVEVTLNG